MRKVRLRAAAREDLVDIRLHSLERFGPRVADRYLRGLRTTFDLLRERPLVGRMAPEIDEGVRIFSHRQHRILYRVTAETVVILRLLHHARQLDADAIQ